MNELYISIIIASRNREVLLWETVSKAYEAIKGKNCDIIVVNDGDSSLIVPGYLANQIVYLDNPKKGVSAARNYGALKAKGNVLFFIDDDMWINSAAIDWINSCYATEKDHEAIYNLNWEYPPALTNQLSHSKIGNYILSAGYNTMWGRMGQHTKQPGSGMCIIDGIGSCSLVMHKAIFERLGGYNESMIFQGEDVDMANRMNKLGMPIYAVFDVTLYHNHQSRLAIDVFLERDYRGFGYECQAIKAGIIAPRKVQYGMIKTISLDLLIITEKGWIFLLKKMPQWKFVTPLNNKLVGMLSGLQYYKQWKKYLK